jgi:hypothetical protein
MLPVAGALGRGFWKFAVLGEDLFPSQMTEVAGVDIDCNAPGIAHCEADVCLGPFAPPSPDGHFVFAGLLCAVQGEWMFCGRSAFFIAAGADAGLDGVQGKDAKAAFGVLEGRIHQYFWMDLQDCICFICHVNAPNYLDFFFLYLASSTTSAFLVITWSR